MGRRIAFGFLATVAVWWFYARHLEPLWGAIAIGAALAGGACGISASWRRWWLPFVPLPVLAAGGTTLSFAFSNTHPFGGDGDWSDRRSWPSRASGSA
jgi:hypothetical protein